MLYSAAVQSIPYRSLFPFSRQTGPHPHNSISVARKFAQGAGSALLVFAGADSITANAAASAAGVPPIADFSSIEGLLATLLNGQLSGPLQIIVAVFVFLTAGQCIARFFGLVFAATVIFLYMQGVTVDDVLVFAQHFSERITAAATAFMNAEVSDVITTAEAN